MDTSIPQPRQHSNDTSLTVAFPASMRSIVDHPEPFVITISNPGKQSAWTAQHARTFKCEQAPNRIVISRDEMSCKVECFTQRQAFTSIHERPDTLSILTSLWSCTFRQWLVQTPTSDVHILVGRDKATIKTKPASRTNWSARHDRQKHRVLDLQFDRAILEAMEMVTADGHLKSVSADKYRQVNHLLDMITSEVKDIPGHLVIVDAGCGKAYMSIALSYVFQREGIPVSLYGFDANPHVIHEATSIASQAGINNFSFVASDIARIHEHAELISKREDTTLVFLALHACNTATDDTIVSALKLGAQHMFIAPCCHHHLQAQMSSSAMPEWAAPLLSDGIIKERLGDLLTDVIRRDIIKAYGYKAQLQEFISLEHTAKNILLRATLKGNAPHIDKNKLDAIVAYSTTLGLHHKLFDLLEIVSATS